MRIAVLSGKGGTGKTLVSTNLAATLKKSVYVDCDVEEPNGHLFFKPNPIDRKKISVKIPVVNDKRCTACRQCVDFCRFNALALVANKLIVFEDICHSCGGCIRLCPEGALTKKDKVIGVINQGVSDGVMVYSGVLNAGQVSGVPIIDALLKAVQDEKDPIFIDCPPGSACIVMESIRDADYCILVAEPTLFGLHNLKMVYELVKLFDKPHGLVINKYFDPDNPIKEFARDNQIKILGEIPFDPELGEINSNARIAVRESPRFASVFENLLKAVEGAMR